jgi:hypothetical protein
MDFSKLLTPGTLTGFVALAAAFAAAAGNTGLSKSLSDPTTVTSLITVAGILAQIAGSLRGVISAPSTPAVPPVTTAGK